LNALQLFMLSSAEDAWRKLSAGAGARQDPEAAPLTSSPTGSWPSRLIRAQKTIEGREMRPSSTSSAAFRNRGAHQKRRRRKTSAANFRLISLLRHGGLPMGTPPTAPCIIPPVRAPSGPLRGASAEPQHARLLADRLFRLDHANQTPFPACGAALHDIANLTPS